MFWANEKTVKMNRWQQTGRRVREAAPYKKTSCLSLFPYQAEWTPSSHFPLCRARAKRRELMDQVTG